MIGPWNGLVVFSGKLKRISWGIRMGCKLENWAILPLLGNLSVQSPHRHPRSYTRSCIVSGYHLVPGTFSAIPRPVGPMKTKGG